MDGFLLKSSDPYELIAAVKAAAGGGMALSPAVARRVVAAVGGGLRRRVAARTRVAALTPRERDVLALLAAGFSNARIGKRLHLVEGTVKIHVGAILRKLDVDNRVQAAVLAHEADMA